MTETETLRENCKNTKKMDASTRYGPYICTKNMSVTKTLRENYKNMKKVVGASMFYGIYKIVNVI